MENNILQVKIKNIRGISFLEINMPLNPDVYAITGINGIGKSTVLSAISPRLVRPINFSMLRDFDFKSDSYISYSLNNNHEIWKPNEQNQWNCITEQCLNLRGFHIS